MLDRDLQVVKRLPVYYTAPLAPLAPFSRGTQFRARDAFGANLLANSLTAVVCKFNRFALPGRIDVG